MTVASQLSQADPPPPRARGDWRRWAACTDQADPSFFDAENDRDMLAHVAQNWCADCSVLYECSGDADAHGEWGLRGGINRRWVERHTGGRGYVYLRDPLIDNAPEMAAMSKREVRRRQGQRTPWTHCRLDHPLAAPNLTPIDKRGHRRCLACSRARSWVSNHPGADLRTEADRYYTEITSSGRAPSEHRD